MGSAKTEDAKKWEVCPIYTENDIAADSGVARNLISMGMRKYGKLNYWVICTNILHFGWMPESPYCTIPLYHIGKTIPSVPLKMITITC